MKLRCENLVKKYGVRTVVKGVSMEVQQGEIVGFLGPNGAGKTTSFYMITGQIVPNGGRIYLDDEDITPSDAHDDPTLTRARARQLNLQVSSFLSKSLYDFENRLLPNDYIVLRNHGEDQGMHKGGLGGVEDQQGRPSQGGGPNQVDFEPVSESRTSEE